MDVHARPAALPELHAFLSAFQVRFRRPEGTEALERYTTGLLTEWPNKNCETIAQAVPGTSEQRLQEFLTNMQWDEADLNRQRVEKMLAEATTDDGVLVCDDPGLPKQEQAAEIPFQTKPEIALQRLDQARVGGPSAVWSPMPTMGTTPTLGRAWRPGRSGLSWQCGPTSSFWSRWRCASAVARPAKLAPAARFPPRPDPCRRSLPAVHREVARGRRHQAVQWWVTTDRFINLCSQRC
jgi:hypothetical protein